VFRHGVEAAAPDDDMTAMDLTPHIEPAPHEGAAGRTAILLNRHSGTIRTMGEDAARALIEEAYAQDETRPEILMVSGPEVEETAKSAIASRRFARIIVGGGDGTVTSVAGLLAGSDIAMGILPLGTMNLQAKAIGMPADLGAALAALREAEVKEIDAARAGERLFLHHVSFGIQPRMVRLRERLGYSSRITKILAAARATIAVLLNPRSQRLGLTIDGEQVELKTPGLIVSNNAHENAAMLKQARLDGGVLGLYALAPMSLVAYLRLAIDVLRGRWQDNVNVTERRGRHVRLVRHRRLRRDSRSIKATLDGELTLLRLPLLIETQPAALRMLVPRTTGS